PYNGKPIALGFVLQDLPGNESALAGAGAGEIGSGVGRPAGDAAPAPVNSADGLPDLVPDKRDAGAAGSPVKGRPQ
ncbi:MAG TPA: hypothetical protein VIL86_10420, partial [Tepidisphaeraceae bacterium]